MASKLLKFRGRVAIVTGAGGGLGEKYALDLAKRGASVIVNDVAGSADKVRAIVKAIIADGGIAKESINSVIDGKDIVADAINHFGGCDILINNAGNLRDKSFHKMTQEDWKRVLDVHLQGTFQVCHAAWPHLREKEYGRVVNIASGAGLYGNFGQANYSAAKMGILGLTNTLAIEGNKYNITVNCVIPIAASQMTANILPAEYLKLFDPDHVTGIVSYLAHESSSNVTGSAFEVGGGWYSKIRWERSEGLSLSRNNEFATAEDIAENFAAICNFEKSTHPTALADSLSAMISASTSNKSEKVTDKPLANKIVTDTVVEVITENTTNGSTPLTVKCKSEDLFSDIQQYFSEHPDRARKGARKVNACIRFEITDSTGKSLQSWKLNMMDYKPDSNPLKSLIFLVRERVDEVKSRTDLVVICSDETFVSLSKGAISPEFAYLRQLLKLKGSAQVGLDFFKFYLDEIISKEQSK